MSPIEALAAAGPERASPQALFAASPAPTATPATTSSGVAFGEMLGEGIKGVEEKIATADKMVRAFALDDSIPIHQVTIALEEARLAVDLAMQVRTRLVEAYREIMNTQL